MALFFYFIGFCDSLDLIWIFLLGYAVVFACQFWTQLVWNWCCFSGKIINKTSISKIDISRLNNSSYCTKGKFYSILSVFPVPIKIKWVIKLYVCQWQKWVRVRAFKEWNNKTNKVLWRNVWDMTSQSLKCKSDGMEG
jgi:hypothetical protein